jgi:hypothetical protein
MSRVPLHDAAAAAGPPGAAERSARPADRFLTPAGWVILAATVLALALRLLQLTRPGHLLGITEYDDGVYFGAAVRLVHGVLPYRDFILVQPPGIVLLMTPVAALSKVVGTAWGMGIARILTACAGAATVTLAGLLVRRRGLLAVIITCGILAVFPDAILAARTVLQEPWLVLFCLAGLLAVFDGDRIASSRARLAWAGVLFGFAGAIKLWAIFPIVVVALLCARPPRRALTYLGGVAAGFLVPVLPFWLLAPSSFYHGVFVAQLVRVDDTRVALGTRLADLLGIASTSGTVHVPASVAVLVAVVIVLVVVGSCVAASVITRSLPSPLEWFALATAGLVLLSFLWPVDFYYHYAGFFAPFLALAVALPLSRLVAASHQAGPRSHGLRLDLGAAGVAVIAIVAMSGVQAATEATAKGANDPTFIPRVIPAGACVLTDQVSLTLMADRFTSDVPGCSQMVDGVGTDLDLSGGRNGVTGAARTPAVRAIWSAAFHTAQYVWLSSDIRGVESRRIAWTPALRTYFAQNFQKVPGFGHVYKRIGLPGP